VRSLTVILPLRVSSSTGTLDAFTHPYDGDRQTDHLRFY
jgi:hypothetical protein